MTFNIKKSVRKKFFYFLNTSRLRWWLAAVVCAVHTIDVSCHSIVTSSWTAPTIRTPMPLHCCRNQRQKVLSGHSQLTCGKQLTEWGGGMIQLRSLLVLLAELPGQGTVSFFSDKIQMEIDISWK